jgi:hypothetical protein
VSDFEPPTKDLGKVEIVSHEKSPVQLADIAEDIPDGIPLYVPKLGFVS